MTCEFCSKEHDGKFASGRFCNLKCSRGFATKAKREQINLKVALKLSIEKILLCKCCGKNFRKPQRSARRRCPDCPDGRTKMRTFEQLLGDRSRKQRLIQERGYQCEICKEIIWMNKPIPLELDHIDGHPGHSEKTNLRIVCPNCHAQQPHYRGANANHHKGTQRQIVMARYPNYRAQKILQ